MKKNYKLTFFILFIIFSFILSYAICNDNIPNETKTYGKIVCFGWKTYIFIVFASLFLIVRPCLFHNNSIIKDMKQCLSIW